MSKKTLWKYGSHKNCLFVKRAKKIRWTYLKSFSQFFKEIYAYYCKKRRFKK